MAVAILGGTGSAGAATLKAEYELQGTRASAVAGAPDLVDLGFANQFATESVGGVGRQALAFPSGGGVSLATAGLVDPRSFSVVMVFRLDQVSGFRRLLDFSGGTSDVGLYVYGGRVVLYGFNGLYAPVPLVAAGEYVQVSLVGGSAEGTQWTEVDLNGDPAVFAEGPLLYTLDAGTLNFFKDNVSGPFGGEESAGALACVLLYDGVLTPQQVAEHGDDPTRCRADPAPPAATPNPPPAPVSLQAPAPGPPSDAVPAFRAGTYVGRTSQGLPISFTVGASSAEGVYFRWRARCADGRTRTRGMLLGRARIREGRFSLAGALETGGRGRVSGSLKGERASGTLGRWGGTASGVSCQVRDVAWRAHAVSNRLARR